MSWFTQPPTAVPRHDTLESCIRDMIKSFYESPFTLQSDKGGPPTITGLLQYVALLPSVYFCNTLHRYVVTDLLDALARCRVTSVEDLAAMVPAVP